MKIQQLHSHLNGHEWLLVHEPRTWKEIERIVRAIDAEQFKTKVSQEKRMRGKLLYAPKQLNARFKADFKDAGWKESRTSYWVTDDLAELWVEPKQWRTLKKSEYFRN